MDEFTRWLPSIVVVVGWWLVNSWADKREDRKEARSLIDAAKETIFELTELGASYHQDGKTELAFAIKSGLEGLEVEFERLPAYTLNGPLMACFNKFADALTGDDFESAEVRKKAVNDPVMIGILKSRTALVAQLERIFRVHYLGLGGGARSR